MDKKIHYEEMVYKVLYNETRTQQAVFEDFWDIDKAHTDLLTLALKNLDLDASPGLTALSEETRAQLEKNIKLSLEAAKQEALNLSSWKTQLVRLLLTPDTIILCY